MRSGSLIPALTLFMTLTGCKADRPGKLEHSAMTWTKHSVSVRNKSERNPLKMTTENLADGKEAFNL
jgi:hypothetical protein